ncbi:MAG: hypothetical protein VKO64_04585 [Candidatus Sericytochromatia bacterium]|nr:hypothetical protein [Candidatus Sericytochromatia bacterium]
MIPLVLTVAGTWAFASAPEWSARETVTLSWESRARSVLSGQVLRGLPTGTELLRSQGGSHWVGTGVPGIWPIGADARRTATLRVHPAVGGLWVRRVDGTPVGSGLAWWTEPPGRESGVVLIRDGRIAWPPASRARDLRLRAGQLEDRITVPPSADAGQVEQVLRWPWSRPGWFAGAGDVRDVKSVAPDAATCSVTVRAPRAVRYGERPLVPWAVLNPGPDPARFRLSVRMAGAELRSNPLADTSFCTIPPFARLTGSLEIPALAAGEHRLAWCLDGVLPSWRSERSMRVEGQRRRFGRRAVLPPGRSSRVEVAFPGDVVPGSLRLEVLATANPWGGFLPALGALARADEVTPELRAATVVQLARLKRRLPWVDLPRGWPGTVPPGWKPGELEAVARGQMQPLVGPLLPVLPRFPSPPRDFAGRALQAEVLAVSGVPMPGWFAASWPPPQGTREQDLLHVLRAAQAWGHPRATQAARHLWTRRKGNASGLLYWDGGVTVTAEALEGLLDVGVEPGALLAGYRWLDQQRLGPAWETPVQTAAVLNALAALQARVPAMAASAAPPGLWLDGVALGPGRPSRGARHWQLVGSRLKPARHVLEVGSAPGWDSGSLTVVWQADVRGDSRPATPLPEGSLRHADAPRYSGRRVTGELMWQVTRKLPAGRLLWTSWTGGGAPRVRLGQRHLVVRQLASGSFEVRLPYVTAGRHRLVWDASAGSGGHVLLPPIQWCPDPIRPRHLARTEEQWLDLPAEESTHALVGTSL